MPKKTRMSKKTIGIICGVVIAVCLNNYYYFVVFPSSFISMIEYLISAISFGFTVLLVMIIGSYLFRKVEGGIQIPLLGPHYVTKKRGFIAFLLSVFVATLVFPIIQGEAEKMMTDYLMTPSVFLVFLLYLGMIWFLFDRLFYSRK